MTATLSRYKTRNPLGAIEGAIMVGLILLPALIKIHLNQSLRLETENEYQSSRTFIVSKIDEALETHDVATLLRLRGKYAGCVADRQFTDFLNDALAKATARETELELTASKHLDLTRHQEELEAHQDRSQSIPGNDPTEIQRLSLLPR